MSEQQSALFGKLEPETQPMQDESAAFYSIAISLKRIADQICGSDVRASLIDGIYDIADRMPR